MEKIAQDIVQKKQHCYFISPHLDDAVLSAGGLLSYLAGKTDVTLITIFTEAGEKPYTMAAKGFLRYCGYMDAKELFADRRKEDNDIANKLGIRTIHLGFIDGSFRRKTHMNVLVKYIGNRIPETEHLYPLGRKLITIAHDDKQLVGEIKNKLTKIVSPKENAVVFCPVGSVKHMDHVLTTKVCSELFQNAYFWTDYPYIQKTDLHTMRIGKTHLQKLVWNKNIGVKQSLIQLYKTQLASLLTTGRLESINEVYWHKVEPVIIPEVKRSYKFPRVFNRFSKAFA